jgi:hypothetical protein
MDKDTNEIVDTLNLILTSMATKDDIAELRVESLLRRIEGRRAP